MCTEAPVLAKATAVLAPAPPGRCATWSACTNPPLAGRQGTRSTGSHAIGPMIQKSAIGRTPQFVQAAGQPVQFSGLGQDDVIKPSDRQLRNPATENASRDRGHRV